MERKFILSCCSTVDLPYSYMEQRDIPVLFYTYVVDGQEYVDDMGRDPEALPGFTVFCRRESSRRPRRSTSRRTSTSLNSSCSTAICCT
ncbi:MAG: hypothetical protein V8S81_06255 [Oscillospiraceae bacterium]